MDDPTSFVSQLARMEQRRKSEKAAVPKSTKSYLLTESEARDESRIRALTEHKEMGVAFEQIRKYRYSSEWLHKVHSEFFKNDDVLWHVTHEFMGVPFVIQKHVLVGDVAKLATELEAWEAHALKNLDWERTSRTIVAGTAVIPFSWQMAPSYAKRHWKRWRRRSKAYGVPRHSSFSGAPHTRCWHTIWTSSSPLRMCPWRSCTPSTPTLERVRTSSTPGSWCRNACSY